MPRVIAFGCSHTHGHCLDQNLTWPAFLGSMLNVEVKNEGIRGAGNYEIFSKILNYDFNNDDIVVVNWSYIDRLPFFRFDNDKGKRIDMNNKFYKSLVSLNEEYEEDLVIRNYLTMQHCSYYLQNKNLKFYNLFCFNHKSFNTPEHFKISIPNFNNDPWEFVDRAPDNGHPGPYSHKMHAEKIYKLLNNG